MADNTIAEVVVKLETDLSDAQQQLLDLGDGFNGPGGVGPNVTGAAEQLTLFGDAMSSIPWADETGQLNLFTDALAPIGEESKKAGEGTDKLKTSIWDMHGILKQAGEEFEHVKSQLSGFKQAFDTAFEAVNELSGGLLEASKGFLELLGIGFAVHEIKEFTEACIELYAEEERVAIGLAHMRGSAELAEHQFEELHEQANKLGISFEPMLNSAVRLAAFGLTAEQTAVFMEAAADSSTAMGTSFQSAASALSRIVETGVMSGRVLRNLGLETKDVAAAMGLANSQVAAVGRELDEETRLAVIRTAQEMKGLSGAAAEAADSTSASLTRFGDAMKVLKIEVGKALSEIATQFVDAGTWIMEEIGTDIEWINKLSEAWDKLGEKLHLSIDVEPPKKKTKEEIAKEIEENKKKAIESGALYKQEAAGIDEVTRAEQSRANIEKIHSEARRKMGLMTSQELIKDKKKQLEADYQLEMDAINEKEKLPKGSKTEEIEKQLRQQRLATIHKFDEQRAKLEAEGEEDVAKIRQSVNAESVKQAEATANHQLEMERSNLAKMKSMHLISAAEAAAAEHSLNKAQLTAAENGIAARAQLQRQKGGAPAEIAATVAREQQAAQEKFAKAEQETNDALAADALQRKRAQAEQEFEFGKEMAAKYLGQERDAAERRYKEGDINFQELTRLRMSFQQKELSDNLDAIYIKQMMDIEGGKNAEDAQKETDRAIEKEYADHNQKMVKIAREYADFMKREGEIMQRERMTVLATEVGLTVAAAEARKRQAGEEAGANQITAAERIRIEREADAEINTARLRQLAQQLANAASMKGSDAERAEATAKVTGEIRKLNDTAARTDAERSNRAAIESARMLGDTYGQVRIHVENLLEAYKQLQDMAGVTANDMQNNWKKVLEGYQQLAESAGHAITVIDQAGKEHVMTLSQIAIAIEVITRQQENQKNQAMLLANVYRDLTSVYDDLSTKFAGGFAQAITQGKKFGDIMMGVLHQIENEILTKLIGTALKALMGAFANLLAGGGAGGTLAKLGTLLGGVAKAKPGAGGATPGGESMARAAAGPAEKALETATVANTAATTANSTGLATQTTGATGMVTALTTTLGGLTTLTGANASLEAAIWMNTEALWATGFIPGAQEGGQVMRTGVALIHAGETVASKNIMQGVGEGLSADAAGRAGGNQIVSFDGATFHGVPDQRYVSGIMNNAVRQLRQSSRTWAFNPTGK